MDDRRAADVLSGTRATLTYCLPGAAEPQSRAMNEIQLSHSWYFVAVETQGRDLFMLIV